MSKLLRICLSGLAVLLVSAAWTQEPIKAVATYSILGDFVENVGGDLVDLTVLVGRDGDAHEYEPTPQDSVAIAEAALVFENGLEFESWLTDLYSTSGSDATKVVVTKGIALRPMTEFGGHSEETHAEEEHTEGEEHAEGKTHTEGEPDAGEGGQSAGEEHSEDEERADEHGDENGEFDPHVWHNPQLVMTIIDNIAAALVTVDPTNEAAYLANAASYKAELEQLDADIQAQVDELPVEQRKMVTSHDALGYFAYRYGFEVIGAVIPSVTTESSDSSAGELAELVDTIQISGVPAIFVENITNAELVEQVANSAGVTLAPALYTDALGEEGTEGGTYLDMMRYNAGTIVEALR
jgi:zinc/manganese transport system substrate-binding protein